MLLKIFGLHAQRWSCYTIMWVNRNAARCKTIFPGWWGASSKKLVQLSIRVQKSDLFVRVLCTVDSSFGFVFLDLVVSPSLFRFASPLRHFTLATIFTLKINVVERCDFVYSPRLEFRNCIERVWLWKFRVTMPYVKSTAQSEGKIVRVVFVDGARSVHPNETDDSDRGYEQKESFGG